MKRTILWVCFATFIVFFGLLEKQNERTDKFRNINRPESVYDTILVYDKEYDAIVTSVRAKFNKPRVSGYEEADTTYLNTIN